MKKFIFIFAVILTIVSCGLSGSESKGDKGNIKETLIRRVKYDLLAPDSFKLVSASYCPTDTLYEGDKRYRELARSLKVNQQLLSEAKTKSNKQMYQSLIDMDIKFINELIDLWYSPKQLSPDVYKEPVASFVATITYKCKNKYGTEVQDTKYYNVIKFHNKVKRQSDGKIVDSYSYEAHETNLISVVRGEMGAPYDAKVFI